MSVDWVGSLVSLDCGDILGTYQGHVVSVDQSGQSISISKAFRNGIQCKVPKITICASDITDLKIVKTASEARRMPVVRQSVVSSSEAACIRNGNDANNQAAASPIKEPKKHCPNNSVHTANARVSPFERSHEAYNNNGCSNGQSYGHHARSFGNDHMRPRTNSESENRGRRSVSSPRRIENNRRRGTQSREDCFSAPVDTFIGDFDFEKNLALFDKKAVFQEIENTHPNIIKAAEKKAPTKYKCDENVLHTAPVVFRQIKLPQQNNGDRVEYVTDSGLVIPSLSHDLRSTLFSAAKKYGFNSVRVTEMVGRSSCEMVLQLLGGSHRLNPQNSHQKPSVVVLCGPHQQGAYGINCSRHLANHNVNVSVFVPNLLKVTQPIKDEISLFELTSGKKICSITELPESAVDIIINTLDSEESAFLTKQPWYNAATSWANQKKANVLAIDPSSRAGGMDTKWSLILGLPHPLPEQSGQLYLCDLGFPKKVFEEIGMKYMSPFGHKFVIPLHRRQ